MNNWLHFWIPTLTHICTSWSLVQTQRATGSLSECWGRGRGTAMTAGIFNQHLTEGGEAARLIDDTRRLCTQHRCCGLHHAALIWCAALSVSYSPSPFIHLSSIQLASFPLLSLLSSSAPPPFTLLITPSFYLPACHSFFSSSSTYSTTGDLSQAFKTDGWWWMVRRIHIPLPLCRSLSFLRLFFSHGLDFVFFDALLKLMRMRLRERDDVLSND